MIHLRKSQDRGHFDMGWLNTFHTFSFGEYHDPHYMGFRSLRVINEDTVQPAEGFPTHPHKNMEIITYILEGSLEHKDSMGNGSVIVPGDVQRMSAGTGVTHSEFNHSKRETVHLLQIWILPGSLGGKPGYEQKKFSEQDKLNRLRLVASPHGEQGSVTIHQDTKIYAGVLEKRKTFEFKLEKERHAWVQIARGSVSLNGNQMEQGDGASISEESFLKFDSHTGAEILLFDLA